MHAAVQPIAVYCISWYVGCLACGYDVQSQAECAFVTLYRLGWHAHAVRGTMPAWARWSALHACKGLQWSARCMRALACMSRASVQCMCQGDALHYRQGLLVMHQDGLAGAGITLMHLVSPVWCLVHAYRHEQVAAATLAAQIAAPSATYFMTCRVGLSLLAWYQVHGVCHMLHASEAAVLPLCPCAACDSDKLTAAAHEPGLS